MKVHRIGAFVVAAALVPSAAAAQVIISEIMYDVSGSDTDREWVEVFNSGSSSVHLTDWKFYEANTNHALVAVQGGETLASGAYVIIADNPTKFLVDNPGYSGLLFDSTFSLSNSGETLAIHMPSPDFTETDSITYQTTAGAAGDGNSLQRSSVSGTAFTAALPTLGTGSLVAQTSNNTNTQTDTQTSTQTQTDTTQTQTQQQTSGLAPVASYVAPPVPEVFVDAGADRTVIVAADTEFDARAYDRKKQVLPNDHVRFRWNFGDGSTAEGPAVEHHYDYPGKYVVIVDIANDLSAASDRVLVTAEPAQLGLTVLPDGGVAIQNKSGRDLDLSRWLLKSFGRTFTIPDKSIVLSGESLRISQKILGFLSGSATELEYPNGVLALKAGQTSVSNVAAPVVAAAPAPVATLPEPKKSSAQQDSEPEVVAPLKIEAVEKVASDTPILATSSQLGAAAATIGGGSAKWWFAAFALAALAAGALVFAKRFSKGEWDIIEETSKQV